MCGNLFQVLFECELRTIQNSAEHCRTADKMKKKADDVRLKLPARKTYTHVRRYSRNTVSPEAAVMYGCLIV
jgi:hypothetical protein